MSDSAPVQTDEQQITITRIFDAPRELVFKAWTDPDQVAKWFGPAGFDAPRESVEIEPRVGGQFNIRMIREGAAMEHWLRAATDSRVVRHIGHSAFRADRGNSCTCAIRPDTAAARDQPTCSSGRWARSTGAPRQVTL